MHDRTKKVTELFLGNRMVALGPDTRAAGATHEAHEGGEAGSAEISIDPDLIGIMPPIKVAEFNRLGASIRNGEHHALVTVWDEESVVLGGLHSLTICRDEDLPFRIERISLPDWRAARAWVIRDQLKRTDITEWHRAELAFHLFPLVEAEAEAKTSGEHGSRNLDALATVAIESSVSKKTLKKAAFILQNAQAAYFDLLDRGEVSIQVVYNTIKSVEDVQLSVGGLEYRLAGPPRGNSLTLLRNECRGFLKYLMSFRSAYSEDGASLDPSRKADLSVMLECARNEIEAFLGVLEDDDRAVVTAASPEA